MSLHWSKFMSNFDLRWPYSARAHNYLMVEGPAICDADSLPAQVNPRCYSWPPTLGPYDTPHHTCTPSPIGDLSSPSQSWTSSPSPNPQHIVKHNIFLNWKMTLDTLYHYPLGTVVEYPETSIEGSVGHLFKICWMIGLIHGWTLSIHKGKHQDGQKGELYLVWVACWSWRQEGTLSGGPLNLYVWVQYMCCPFLNHALGQGCKVCPYVDMVEAQKPHQTVTAEDLKLHHWRAGI